ncbi:hypothetical protein OJF2_28090 [Aquisphaera giovannonii]|uniref:Helix-turn-helix domain protein n=1 Tax=Aquisphaera giovannonii TaxID=406548 RepID=A0A5B9W215_9BACT|nr:hypothetical protein OJF2_28090 [Aquisphaera giovannonii]
MTPTRPRRPILADPASTRPAIPPEAPHGIEPMLSIADLARVLAVSRRLIERERAAGRLPRPDLQMGRCPRWRAETIRRWIETGGRA